MCVAVKVALPAAVALIKGDRESFDRLAGTDRERD